QGIGEQLATEVVDKLVLALRAEIMAQAVESRPVATIGKGRLRLHGPATEVAGAAFADGAVALEGEADRIEALVTAGAGLVLAMACQELRQGLLAELGF